MPFAGDFIPPVSPGEVQPFSVDFALQIANGDSIASASAALSLHAGADPALASRLVGAATISGSVVTQYLGSLQPGAVYSLALTIVTAGGQTRTNWGRVACVAVS